MTTEPFLILELGIVCFTEATRKKNRVFIEGAAIQQKHQKPTQQGQKGKILKKEGPIHYSNVLLYSEKSKKGERICTVGEGKNKKRVVISEKPAA